MRPDGTRVKGLTPIMRALPYIMPRRFDAQNWASDYVDEDIMKAYIRKKRRDGQAVTHMSVLVAAYYKAALENPKVNYFVMNRKIYQRNHFCFSFVILKTRADGTPDETTLKIHLEPEDTVFSISRKIKEHIDRNAVTVHNNSTDRFANAAFAIPGLARLVFWLAYHLDLHGLLPRKVIDLSPFHTSLFITNLASINTSYIFHHCYEFGTTSVFICMGKPVPDPMAPTGSRKKQMPLGVVMDERIATGIEYSRFFAAFSRYLKQPEILENRLDGKEQVQAVAAYAEA
ncbi:hypothetical protein SAMN05216343_1075 [Oscillibacter sp. PC13]|uniref:hypothetical protein n=1 Tax=Oscillibacter sp. PC13 TaxID=1855299 RepID=UPI0008F3C39B|nr:hypothetical protein [Oscillibacter sp. PC13]SFP40041.1 hypothetical protein SAMN05216343_1075 [Oscillibacter sp. PC13]